MLSGGDASRLQYPFPKGLYNISANNYNSTLFGTFMERLASLEMFISKYFNEDQKLEVFDKIKIFVIVSDEFLNITKDYFTKNNNFNFKNIFFLPAKKSICVFDLEGKIVLKNDSKILKASFGNGDLMNFLTNEVYDKMQIHGIDYLHITGIDNILNIPLDPLLIGLMKYKKLNIIHKIVEKKVWSENVGLFIKNKDDDSIEVMEYTYFPEEFKRMKDIKLNKLAYRHANLLNFVISKSIIEEFISKSRKNKNGYIDSKNFLKKINFTKRNFKIFNIKTKQLENKECVKMERFFLDCFPLIDINKHGFIIVEREKEFAPIKSKYNSKDTPQNALQMFYNFCCQIDPHLNKNCSIKQKNNEENLVKCTKCSFPHYLESISNEDIDLLKENEKIFSNNIALKESHKFTGNFIEEKKFYSLILKI